MAIEIERKFLVDGDGWRGGVSRMSRLRQGYLARGGRSSVRVRIADDRQAWLTIKAAAAGLARAEFEYAVPVDDAVAMLVLAEGAIVAKVRHAVPLAGLVWEVDVFEGANAGLVIAEVELPAADHPLTLPGWVGREVTDDRRYYNASLSERPWREWQGEASPAPS